MEALRDIAKEIHEIEVKNVNHKKNGYITSTVGRYTRLCWSDITYIFSSVQCWGPL